MEETFLRIYRDGLWGNSEDPDDPYFSGSGSHAQAHLDAYVLALEAFLRAFPNKPDVVDLGCGDFAVGSRIRPFCGTYVACDIVAPLIERNRRRFASLAVDFRILDITSDLLPTADVAILRQVLQHLSNDQIQSAVDRISSTYRYMIVTEHLPSSADFVPNTDKIAGPHTRIDAGGPPSGVVLTEPPFNLKPRQSSVICEVSDYLGLLRTIVFEFDRASSS